ncbi:hypothetical protein [Hydrogenimonas sp.]
MSTKEIFPADERRPVSLFGIPLKRIVLALITVVAIGVYTGILLFGPNSLTVLLELEEQRTTYERHIKFLKTKNAALQKEYFELKQLEPDQ